MDGAMMYREPVWIRLKWMRPLVLGSLVFWYSWELEQYVIVGGGLVADTFGSGICRILTSWKSFGCLLIVPC